MRIAVLAITVVAIGLAIVAYLQRDPQGTEQTEPAPSSYEVVNTPARSRAEANAPSDASVPAVALVAEPPVDAQTLAPAPLPGQTPVTPMAQLLEARRLQFPPEMVQGERDFAAEEVDATWAPGAEADILGRIARMPGLALIGLQVECRSTMCRLQAASRTSPGAAAPPFNVLVDSVGIEPRWMIAVIDESGALQSVAYLWRDGVAP